MNKVRSKVVTMHFNKCNRDKEEWQKTINTNDPVPSNSPCTDGQARGQEDSGFTGKYWGLTPIPPSKNTCTVSCLKARLMSYLFLHSQHSACNLQWFMFVKLRKAHILCILLWSLLTALRVFIWDFRNPIAYTESIRESSVVLFAK